MSLFLSLSLSLSSESLGVADFSLPLLLFFAPCRSLSFECNCCARVTPGLPSFSLSSCDLNAESDSLFPPPPQRLSLPLFASNKNRKGKEEEGHDHCLSVSLPSSSLIERFTPRSPFSCTLFVSFLFLFPGLLP